MTSLPTTTTTTSPSKTISLFGATGGTGLAILNHALSLGPHIHINVLARTPSVLSQILAKYPSQLHVTKGSISDHEAVKSVLVHDGRVADVVISAIGMVFKLNGGGFKTQSNICEEATKEILLSLSELETELPPSSPSTTTPSSGAKGEGKGSHEPLLVLLSTTGISHLGRDIPFAMMPLYSLLHTAHSDKAKMEEVVLSSSCRFVLVRPSFLMNGETQGMGKVRVSVETREGGRMIVGSGGNGDGKGKEGKGKEGPAIGYTINRVDVGGWIVEELVKGDAREWEGKMVTITY